MNYLNGQFSPIIRRCALENIGIIINNIFIFLKKKKKYLMFM